MAADIRDKPVFSRHEEKRKKDGLANAKQNIVVLRIPTALTAAVAMPRRPLHF